MGIAANKSDLIEKEDISENEAREYAKEIKAIFRVTSASTSSGIEELFRIIGCKILDPYYTEEEGEEPKSTEKPKQDNIENEKKDENDDKRISLNIEGFDLDKYFQQEGVNKRNIEQKEVSDSLKTINLEENYKSQNSQIMIENEKQQNNLGNSNISNISNNDDNIKREESGEELIMIDDALKGSVHIPENIQDFVKKNNELYNDNK